MEALRIKGLMRHIGLSNVTVNHLKRALEVKVPISWVQVEMHPLYYDAELLDFCRKYSITVQAWRPLNLGLIREDKLLSRIGKKYGKNSLSGGYSVDFTYEQCWPRNGEKPNSKIFNHREHRGHRGG